MSLLRIVFWLLNCLLLVRSSLIPAQYNLRFAFPICRRETARVCHLDCSLPISEEVHLAARSYWSNEFRHRWGDQLAELPPLSELLRNITTEMRYELASDSIDASDEFLQAYDACIHLAEEYNRRREVLADLPYNEFMKEFIAIHGELRGRIEIKEKRLHESKDVMIASRVRAWYAMDVAMRVQYGLDHSCEQVAWDSDGSDARRSKRSQTSKKKRDETSACRLPSRDLVIRVSSI